MKTIFDKSTRDELIQRINSLTENNGAQWGKMNLYQMLKHCTLWEEMMQGKRKYKQTLIGRLLGKSMLKSVLKDENPLRHSTPTLPDLVISGTGNVEEQKKEWIKRIQEYAQYEPADFVHVFFGKMSKEQIGQFVYKHSDHHLRQFGV